MILKNLVSTQIDNLAILSLVGLAITWCIPETISLRYFFALIILFILAFHSQYKLLNKDPININLILFILFLLLYLILSSDFSKSFKSIKSEWLKFIIFSIMGAQLAYSNLDKKKILLYMGIGFSLVNYLYVFYYCLYLKSFEIPKFLIHHGYIAYTSLTSSLLLMILLVYNRNKIISIIILITLQVNLISLIYCGSRGGILFNILSIIVFIFILIYLNFQIFKIQIIKLILLILLSILFLYLNHNSEKLDNFKNITENVISKSQNSEKFQNFDNILKIGLVSNPIDVLCNGYYPELYPLNFEIKNNENFEKAIEDLNKEGTSARIVTARASYLLLKYNLWGKNLDTINSFKLILRERCDGKPKIELANSHNGWLDLTHAMGLIGLVLFLFFYIYPLIIFLRSLNSIKIDDLWISVGGFIFIFIWFLRGMLDATMRDHMLEIQAFFIFYFYYLFKSKYGR